MARASVFGFDVGSHGRVSAAIHRAAEPLEATLVLAHGAGAPRTHPFMADIASRIAEKGVDVVTFNFLYAEVGRKMPDRPELLLACFRAALAAVRARGGLPNERIFIGGKSMGGRFATRLAAEREGPPIAGVVVLGYPLHPMGKPTGVRREILDVRLPMLVVQGTRDALGTAAELGVFIRSLARARVVPVEGADHSFSVSRARAGEGAARQDAALDAVAAAVATFVRRRARARS